MRSVAHIVTTARKYRRWVGVCGEIASDPRLTPFLVGLGVNDLSMEPNALNAVKQAISRTTTLRAAEAAQRVLQADTAEEVESILSALAAWSCHKTDLERLPG
jgi:phosphoenolpyruvate-protein kinase (PTS system EI component)